MKKLKKIYIEITNVCNLDCVFCPKTSREPGFMGISFFEEILKEVKDHTEYILFHVMGEALMHPDIDIMLDLCGKYGCKVNITTNGTMIKKVRDKLLFKPALKKISFSTHIFDEKTPDIIVDEYLDNIFNFLELNRKHHRLTACFRFWNGQNKNSSFPEQGQWDNGKNLYILGKIEKFCNVPFPLRDNLSGSGGIKIAEDTYIERADFFSWPLAALTDKEDRGFCLGLRHQAAILVDGTVVPCCLDNEGTMPLGNIKENSFADILKGKRAVAIYEGFSARKIVEPLCAKCGYRKRFDKDPLPI